MSVAWVTYSSKMNSELLNLMKNISSMKSSIDRASPLAQPLLWRIWFSGSRVGLAHTFDKHSKGFLAPGEFEGHVLTSSAPVFFPLSTTNWHLPSSSTGIKSRAAEVADLQQPLKGAQGREQKWGAMCSRKTGGTGLQIDGPILWAQFLYLLKSRKALKFFMMMPAPWDQQKPSAKKICAWLHVLFPLHQNQIYTDLPHYLFGAISQSYLRCCLLG